MNISFYTKLPQFFILKYGMLGSKG